MSRSAGYVSLLRSPGFVKGLQEGIRLKERSLGLSVVWTLWLPTSSPNLVRVVIFSPREEKSREK